MTILHRLFLGLLLFAFAQSTSALTTQTDGPLAPQQMTLEKWQALSADDKELLLEGIDIESYSNLSLIELNEDNALAKVPRGAAQAFAEQMAEFMRTNSNLEVEDEHSRVGPVQVYWISLLMIDEQVLAGSIGFLQRGCSLEEDNWQYFETEAEAEAAGCDTNADVSWQAHATFDEKLSPIRYDEYMEWSGH